MKHPVRTIALAAMLVLPLGRFTPAAAHEVPGGGTKYTVTVATAQGGNTGSIVSSGYRTGSSTKAQRSDYVTAGQRAVGSLWAYHSVSNCGRTTCRVKFLAIGRSLFPVTTTVTVTRFRHNHLY